MPTAQDFCDRAELQSEGGKMLARLDGVIYPVVPFGADAVQMMDPVDGGPVATLTFVDGKFVPAGPEYDA